MQKSQTTDQKSPFMGVHTSPDKEILGDKKKQKNKQNLITDKRQAILNFLCSSPTDI